MSRKAFFAASVAAHTLLVALVPLFYGGFDAQRGVVRLDMSPEQMVGAYGQGDAGSTLERP